jgi:hypothetical protein
MSMTQVTTQVLILVMHYKQTQGSLKRGDSKKGFFRQLAKGNICFCGLLIHIDDTIYDFFYGVIVAIKTILVLHKSPSNTLAR